MLNALNQVKSRIDRLSLDELEKLGDAFLDFESLAKPLIENRGSRYLARPECLRCHWQKTSDRTDSEGEG
jgi:hypothetical protein